MVDKQELRELVSELWLHGNSLNSIAGAVRYNGKAGIAQSACLYAVQRDLTKLLDIVDADYELGFEEHHREKFGLPKGGEG